MSTARLYHGEPNGPSLSVLAALEESGLDLECSRIDLLRGERHALRGLAQRVTMDFAVEGEGPVLVTDGEALAEAVFIAQYLDEAARDAGTGASRLQPDDPYTHWRMMMWCRQVTERLSPAVAYLGNFAFSRARLAEMGDAEFAKLVAGIAGEDLKARWIELREGALDEAKQEDSRGKIAQFAARIEELLAEGQDWLIGEYSIADIETYAWMAPALLLEPGAFAGKPLLAGWMNRMAARPAILRALARATVADPRTSFAPGPEINRWG